MGGRKKREEKRTLSAGDKLWFCIENRLETLTHTPAIHSFQMLVTNLRNI